MEIEKAIEWQKAFKKTYKGNPMEKEVLDACDMAIEVLEKQIPCGLLNGLGYVFKCKKCGRIIDLAQGELNFCPNCGNKLED